MKNFIIFTIFILNLIYPNISFAKVISNEKINQTKVKEASKILLELQSEIEDYTKNGSGPFVAAIYDKNGNLVIKTTNSVVNSNCSNNHAEMNAIREAEKFFGTYDLSQYNLKIYVTSEPCIMCLGGIMWSGIKELYYGVPSKDVEDITGFDEGFKPHWFNEFKKRGIIVYGNIETNKGKQELYKNDNSGKNIYKPTR